MTDTKPVALFCDTKMLPGLHVTLASLLQALEPGRESELEVHLFLDKVGARDRLLLQQTFEQGARGACLVLHEFSPPAPDGGNTLHGNTTTYGRLHLHTLLAGHDRCVYLDSDLVVNRSVLDLFAAFDGTAVLLADGTGRRDDSVDTELFRAAGIDVTGPYFNAGILGIDLALWRRRGISQACEETARKYAGMFRSADQALLNTVLHDGFKPVGTDWNFPLYPSTPELPRLEARIYHFVGSPKPWDPFGRSVVRNHPLWMAAYRKTAIGGRSYLRYASLGRSVRIFKIVVKGLIG
ncbi:MAG: glycosyltransferase [Pseudomonadota bacterium]